MDTRTQFDSSRMSSDPKHTEHERKRERTRIRTDTRTEPRIGEPRCSLYDGFKKTDLNLSRLD